jgi:putative PIG3 family NAD(P)H quinone oxidoreductase
MRAIVVDEPGGPEVLHVGEVADPVPEPADVIVRVASAGVNRADLLQRMGVYPPPPGASHVLGLEVAGVVAAVGDKVTAWAPGDRVMALIAGGGYAEFACVPEAQLMRVPDNIDLISAGGVPEVFITAHDNLFTRARLERGETVLVHGGAGGVGTAAIQLAKQHGCRVVATAGSAPKRELCSRLGADETIDYRSEDFVERTGEYTGDHGADVILDVMGAAYLERNVQALAADGRLVVIGMQGGTSAELDLGRLLRKRGAVITTMLRARPAAQKAAIVATFIEAVLPALAAGTLRPIIDRILPLEAAAEAHRLLEAGAVSGKVVLQVAEP